MGDAPGLAEGNRPAAMVRTGGFCRRLVQLFMILALLLLLLGGTQGQAARLLQTDLEQGSSAWVINGASFQVLPKGGPTSGPSGCHAGAANNGRPCPARLT